MNQQRYAKTTGQTQLNNFFQDAQGLVQSVALCVNDLNSRLAKHRNMFRVDFIQGMTRANGKTERGDLVSSMALQIAVQNHSITHNIKYSVLALGTECTIYREITEVTPGKQTRPVEGPTVVLRCQGETEIDRAAVVADIRETVTRSIPLLSQRIQNGY